MLRKILLAAAVVCGVAVPAASAAPTVLTGELDGAPYRIVVPERWNGTLVTYAHGYRDRADHPGELDDRRAEAAPVAELETALAAMGYALAGSAYKRNGWAVQEGIEDTVALTSFFRDTVGKPTRSLLWGFSMGSLVTFEIAERTAGHFDGYLPACAVGAGAPRAWDGAGATALAYDVAFGWPAGWGSVADVRDDVDFETQVVPTMFAHVTGPFGFGKSEFVRLVTGAAPSGLPTPWSPGPPNVNWLFTNMFFGTEARAELERRAGGAFVQNVTHHYSLTADEKRYLRTLGVDADPLLAAMNARTNLVAATSARNYLEHWADYSGKIKKPVLTLHTQTDALVPVSHESAYAATVDAAGRAGLLAQAFTTGIGHCAFSGAQLVTALTALDSWVATGVKPTAASFPAALGFLPGFEPPAWPQQ